MLVVTNVYDVLDTIEKYKINAVLSIEHPGAKDGYGRAPRLADHDLGHIDQHILCFWDVNDERATNGPSLSVVQDAFRFLDAHEGQRMLVHCKAGRSRSVALAIGWLAQRDGIENTINTIRLMRPTAAPNLALIDIIDREYGFNGTLSAAVRNDPIFAPNNEAVEQRRQEIAREHPELLRQLYPEKTNTTAPKPPNLG